MSRILVTGGSGFIGSRCVSALEARGLETISPSSSELDLLDEAATRRFLDATRPTHLLHTAWRHIRGNAMSALDNLEWLKASITLIQAFHQAGGVRAAALGSSAEYDWNYGQCQTGATPLRPESIYGASKLALYTAMSAYARQTGLSFVWPRVFFVYGPGEHESRITPYVIKSLVAGQPAQCTNGLQVRDYVHVDDVANAVVKALFSSHEGEIDVASGAPLPVRDLVLEIARQLGREDLVQLGARPSPPNEAPYVIGDPKAAMATLGWCPQFTLEQGISDTITRERRSGRLTSAVGIFMANIYGSMISFLQFVVPVVG